MIRSSLALLRLALAAALLVLSMPLLADSLQEYLRQSGKEPSEYVLSKVDQHRIVIVGENHWQRSDAELIASIVPGLRTRNAALAMEVLLAASQEDIDRLVSAPEWDQALANKVLRAADWPYVQYRDILHEVWKANRAGAPQLKVLALGPPQDWRKQGIRYDSYMAEHVRGYATDDQHRILVYCGMHHAFTRYLQVERFRNGRPSEFMDRMGNILWRQFGQDVFLVALHKPDGCGEAGNSFAKLCAPLGGVIDCAATRNGGHAVGFDILGSPLAEMKFDSTSFYAAGHPLLRLIDFADGYVWQQPVDDTRMVDLIPLNEYDAAGADDPEKNAQWKKDADDLANPSRRASRASLPDWRTKCAAPAPR